MQQAGYDQRIVPRFVPHSAYCAMRTSPLHFLSSHYALQNEENCLFLYPPSAPGERRFCGARKEKTTENWSKPPCVLPYLPPPGTPGVLLNTRRTMSSAHAERYERVACDDRLRRVMSAFGTSAERISSLCGETAIHHCDRRKHHHLPARANVTAGTRKKRLNKG